MIAPLNLAGPLSGIVIGIAFGFILEGAGFGSPCILTGQLRFTNWAVFKTMFTAIIVSAALLYAASGLGLLHLNSIFIPSVYFWGTLLGGVGVGIGMGVGGYCPGTSVVGFVSGRLDALLFLGGIGAGTLLFNVAFPTIGSWVYAQTGPSALTLPQLFHLPAWAIIALLLAVLVAVGRLVGSGSGGASKNSAPSSLNLPNSATVRHEH